MSTGRQCFLSGPLVGRSHCSFSEVMGVGMPPVRPHGWVDLLAGLHIQVGLLCRIPGWVGLWAVLHSQVAGLCNHLWVAKVSYCVSETVREVPLVGLCNWAELQAGHRNCSQAVFPSWMCDWFDSEFRQSSRQYLAVS